MTRSKQRGRIIMTRSKQRGRIIITLKRLLWNHILQNSTIALFSETMFHKVGRRLYWSNDFKVFITLRRLYILKLSKLAKTIFGKDASDT
ncbi:hypothetical protein C2G38_2102195 [Gigaspora rosea]|uniref:Uncharacterized protein n=1 Tax=Gigaspora rosea TaxID=44941 RepID=A0A397UP76_9GLOM|nr:hypothetical protein C2G38_2102195 [Gigaspora rosea]